MTRVYAYHGLNAPAAVIRRTLTRASRATFSLRGLGMENDTKLRAWRRGDVYPRTPEEAAFLGHGAPTCSYCGGPITLGEYTEQMGGGTGSVRTGVWACNGCRYEPDFILPSEL